MQNQMVYAGAQMPRELEKQARILAAQMGISRSELFRLALEKFLKEEKTNEMSRDNREKEQN